MLCCDALFKSTNSRRENSRDSYANGDGEVYLKHAKGKNI